jgi:hypothetical protein
LHDPIITPTILRLQAKVESDFASNSEAIYRKLLERGLSTPPPELVCL